MSPFHETSAGNGSRALRPDLDLRDWLSFNNLPSPHTTPRQRVPMPMCFRPSPASCAEGRCRSAPASRMRTPGRPTSIRAGAVAFVLAGLVPPPAFCEPQGSERVVLVPGEYARKAALLYGLGRYGYWPESCFPTASDPFVIGVLGKDPFGGLLDRIAASKTIQDRPVVVRRFASVDEYRQPCHILFVSHFVPAEQEAALIAKTQGNPVLVVGETAGFGERGAIANFYRDEERIRFELNIEVARQAQLDLDAKLLSLGKPVAMKPSGSPN
jgi:hypothetical protein